MNVFFAGSLYYKDKYLSIYKKIIDVLEENNCKVFEDTMATPFSEAISRTDNGKVDIYRKVLKWISEADYSVFEASFPSTVHIGHEITLTLEKNKPVIILYTKGAEPTVLKGLKDNKIIWVEYSNEKDLETKLEDAIYEVKEHLDIRFDFFVNSKLLDYLNWVSKELKMPRSVYIRELIKREMNNNDKYNNKG